MTSGPEDASSTYDCRADRPASASIDDQPSTDDSGPLGRGLPETVDADALRGIVLSVLVLAAIAHFVSVSDALGTFFLGVSVVLAYQNRSFVGRRGRLAIAYALLFALVSMHYFGVVQLV